MNSIVLASGNKGKLREFAHMFAPMDIEIIPQADFGVPEVAETGLTFVENAVLFLILYVDPSSDSIPSGRMIFSVMRITFAEPRASRSAAAAAFAARSSSGLTTS